MPDGAYAYTVGGSFSLVGGRGRFRRRRAGCHGAEYGYAGDGHSGDGDAGSDGRADTGTDAGACAGAVRSA